jgi:hypothetical protein
MANRFGQYSAKQQRRSDLQLAPRPPKLAWLEWVLPVCAAGLLLVMFRPDMVPPLLSEPAASPLAWIAWGVIGALSGIVLFSAALVVFFLLYSPVYLAGKVPALVGKGGWTDRREIRFYGLCFLLLCLMIVLSAVSLMTGDWRWVGSVFLVVTGFSPVVWRALV